MPFGGHFETCLSTNGPSLDVAWCSPSNAQQRLTFVKNASPYVSLETANGLCVDIQYGNETAGVIDVTTCNGTVNQQWLVQGGQVVSANTSNGTNNFCLDVHYGNTSPGALVDLAPCNGTPAQSFWPAGYTMGIASTLVDSTNYAHPECLDVLWNNEATGASLDDSDCNGSAAQWFVLNTKNQITLANNPNLCVTLTGNVVNGTPAVALEPCAAGMNQQWYLGNKSVNGRCTSSGFIGCSLSTQSAFVNFATGCLDILDDSSRSPTAVDDYACTANNQAQLWVPFTPYNQPSWGGPAQ
jgi:hypothetical protein